MAILNVPLLPARRARTTACPSSLRPTGRRTVSPFLVGVFAVTFLEPFRAALAAGLVVRRAPFLDARPVARLLAPARVDRADLLAAARAGAFLALTGES